jgi:hypothetical protein
VGWTEAGCSAALTEYAGEHDPGLDALAQSETLEECEELEAKVAPTLGERMKSVFGDEVKGLHPAGRKRSVPTQPPNGLSEL